MDKMACLFCQKDGSLHEFKTLEADHSIRKIAAELQDIQLMARMEGGDLVALEAKYHLGYLRNSYKNRSSINQQGKEHSRSSEEDQLKARAFLELLAHIENCVENETFSFKFSAVV